GDLDAMDFRAARPDGHQSMVGSKRTKRGKKLGGVPSDPADRVVGETGVDPDANGGLLGEGGPPNDTTVSGGGDLSVARAAIVVAVAAGVAACLDADSRARRSRRADRRRATRRR